MKRRFAAINVSLVVAILSSILFQSVHSFEHILSDYSGTKCIHPHDTGKFQITHQHHNFDHCFACEFSFSNFLQADTFSFSVFLPKHKIPYFFPANETPVSYSGSSRSLRGPPRFIV